MSAFMFSGANLVSWIFGCGFATSIGLILFSFERMRVRLNHARPPKERVPEFPPRARSFDELIFKTNVLAHYLGLMDQYRRHHPSSSLPKMILVGVIGLFVSAVGIFAAVR
jgi:hypothetical protein